MGELVTATTETTTGPVVGRQKNGAWLFAGIPYAAPPVGALRFKRPNLTLLGASRANVSNLAPQHHK